MSSRRSFVSLLAGASAGALVGSRRAPALVASETARPLIPFGAAVGDASDGRAIVWSRADRPARLLVEWSTRASFQDPRRLRGPLALPETGLTARVELSGLPAGQTIVYRVRFEDPADGKAISLPCEGSFRTPRAASSAGATRIAWSADVCGQGFGIDLARGGLRGFEAIRMLAPDLFVHCGDTIYADNPLAPELTLDDGSLWRNLVTPAKAKVAETLDDYRGNYLYNLQDENLRRFNAEIAQLVIWDDHEVRNNWYEGQQLDDDPLYREKSVSTLARHARRAFFEHQPIRWSSDEGGRVYRRIGCGPFVDVFAIDMRTSRGPNSANTQPVAGPETALLGRTQLDWLKRSLAASRATWKVVACGMPLGLVVPDVVQGRIEGVANGDPGAPLGRELELAELLSFLRRERVQNVVWITGDVHYAAAHHYHPERARYTDFEPFWEFVAGPLHAGTFGPNALDPSFGPEASFVSVPQGMKPNRPPSEGLQFFGTLDTDPSGRVLTARLFDVAGRELNATRLRSA